MALQIDKAGCDSESSGVWTLDAAQREASGIIKVEITRFYDYTFCGVIESVEPYVTEDVTRGEGNYKNIINKDKFLNLKLGVRDMMVYASVLRERFWKDRESGERIGEDQTVDPARHRRSARFESDWYRVDLKSLVVPKAVLQYSINGMFSFEFGEFSGCNGYVAFPKANSPLPVADRTKLKHVKDIATEASEGWYEFGKVYFNREPEIPGFPTSEEPD